MVLDQTDQLRTARCTDAPDSALEHVQVELGLGRGFDASAGAETVAVEDLGAMPEYADLGRRIESTGVRVVLASPVGVSGMVGGNLNAVRHRTHQWSADEIRANEAYAKVIGVTLDLAAGELGETR